MHKTLAIILSLALTLPGCAPRHAGIVTPANAPAPGDTRSLAAAVAKIPVGTRLRVDLSNGRRLRGTLMRVSDTSLLLNPRTRVPEPPVEIAFAQLQGFDLDQSSGNIVKVIAISAAAGAAAAVGTMMFIVAFLIDD